MPHSIAWEMVTRYDLKVSQGGEANIPEFGSVKVAAEVRALYAISCIITCAIT